MFVCERVYCECINTCVYVCDMCEHVFKCVFYLYELQVVSLVELSGEVTGAEVAQHVQEQIEACLCHVALCVPERPHNGVYDELKLDLHAGQCQRGSVRGQRARKTILT